MNTLNPLISASPQICAPLRISASPIYAKILKKRLSSNKRPPPPACFIMEEYLYNKGCIGLVAFNHKQVIIDAFKHCTSTVATDGSEDLLIHCLNPNQPCAAGLNRL